jgi:hypothetical protein
MYPLRLVVFLGGAEAVRATAFPVPRFLPVD